MIATDSALVQTLLPCAKSCAGLLTTRFLAETPRELLTTHSARWYVAWAILTTALSARGVRGAGGGCHRAIRKCPWRTQSCPEHLGWWCG